MNSVKFYVQGGFGKFLVVKIWSAGGKNMPKTGSNIRRRSDGRWEGRYKYLTPEKIFKMRSVYGKTYREVKKKMELLIVEQNENIQQMADKRAGSYLTFGEVSGKWLSSVEKTKKYSTYVKYRGICEKHLEILKEVRMNEISGALLNEKIFWDKESMYTQNLKHTVIQIVNQVIRFSNDIHSCHIPLLANRGDREKGKKIKIINQAGQTALLRYLSVDTDSFKTGICLCHATGLRLGEICSLKWEDIDFDQRIIHINRTIQRIAVTGGDTKTALMESSPKSAFSMREIPVSSHIIRILGGLEHTGEYVIGGKKPVEPRTYENRFKRYAEKAGIGTCNFHMLRHTFATNCIENGMDAKTLSEILGHANVQITLNRYVHPTIESKRNQMEKMDDYYGNVIK